VVAAGHHGRRHRRGDRAARLPGLPEARRAGAETLKARTFGRALAWTLGGALAVALLLVAAAPWLIDAPAVQAEIQRRLARLLGGQVTWQALEVRLLPVPHGEVRGLRIEIPDRLNAAAEEVEVSLRLWPLLRGRPEVSSFTLKRAQVRVAAAGGGARDAALPDALALYRAAVEPAARALRDLAPDTAFGIEDGRLEIGPGFALRELKASARTDRGGVAIDLAAAGNLWKRLSAQGRVEYADLAARAELTLEALALDNDLPPATVRARLRTDARTAVEIELEGSAGSLVSTARGTLTLPAGKPPELAAEIAGVDLARGLAIARLKGVPLEFIETAEGKVSVAASASLGAQWQARLRFARSDAAVKLVQLPWKLAPRAAEVALSPQRVSVTALEGSLGQSTFSGVAAEIDLGAKRLSSASGRAALELGQWLPWLRDKLPLEEIASASGSVEVALHRLALPFERPANVEFEALATPRKVDVALKALPAPVQLAGGSVHASAKRVRGAGLRGSIGASTFSEAAFEIELEKPARVSSASAAAQVQLEPWFAWLRTRLPLEQVASLSGAADVRLNRLALRFDRPAEADFEAAVAPRQASVALKALPGPVSVSGGSIRASAGQVRVDDVAVAMLDARTRVSGSIALRDLALELALAEGAAGEKTVRWALERAAVPGRLEPKTPLRFTARRLAWAKGALAADARIAFEGGPELGVELGWQEQRLEVKSATIKDARSDARLSAAVAAERIQAAFSGTLHGASIAAMLKRPGPETASGVARGDLRVTVDRKRAQDSIGEGRLQVEALDLSWLAGTQALIERADLSALPDDVRVIEARFSWADQKFALRGEGRRTRQGPVIDARLESPGVDVERLRPKPDPARKKEEPSALWPLPITGRIEVRAGYLQLKRNRIEPFDGILTLERERARLEVKEARTCGVSFPLQLDATPKETSLAARISMRDEPLEAALKCLTGGRVALTGNIDLAAELKTTGQGQQALVRNLSGTAQAEARNGRLNKFALIGNILAFRGISSLEEMNQQGFRYRRMTAKGRFENGVFRLDEGFFDSDAVRLAANGNIDLLGPNSHLNVLVALLSRAERVVGAVPILGDVFGGTMLALPVAVNGDIRDPLVVPLGPRAISSQLLGIFERTLKLPGRLGVPAEASKPAP
jgi:hypothetical protein